MRTNLLATAAVLAAFSYAAPALAQATTPAANPPAANPPAAAPAAPPADPVIARVNGADIHLSDLQQAAVNLPEQYRSMPQQMLYPMLVDQLVDRRALTDYAHKIGFDHDPAVRQSMQRAADTAMQNALISREVGPQVTEDKVRARYDATLANQPGEPEVHAAHILVANEDQAKKIIAQLAAGGDFAAIAKAQSTDPGAAQGGDLGFFKKGDMLPEFAATAFALKPGQVSQTPVHTRYGWHVIKVIETRVAPPPTYAQAHDELRQAMIQEAVQKVIKQAREGEKIETFNPDGSPVKPATPATAATTDSPPSAPAASTPATSTPAPATPAPAAPTTTK